MSELLGAPMSRRRRHGIVYLLHFDQRYYHAGHYLGFCEPGNLADRLDQHARGAGGRLPRAVAAAGISWRLVAVWRGTRDDERRLKRNGGGARFCHECASRPRRAKLKRLVVAL